MRTLKLFLDPVWTGRLRFEELTVLLRLSKRASSSRYCSETSPPCERTSRGSDRRTRFVGVDLAPALQPYPSDWTILNWSIVSLTLPLKGNPRLAVQTINDRLM